MGDVTPHVPNRPLFWPDFVEILAEALRDVDTPIYIVGGAVRDSYLHRPVKDIDLATPDDAIALARRIAHILDCDVFVMDASRGVARLLVDQPGGRLVLDVAAFRSHDLFSDLSDRDFTVNAMAVDLRGDLNLIIDPLRGAQDAEKKLIRRCSPGAIAADPIRALRAVRQSVQLSMRIESETLRDIRVSGPSLIDTSPERVRDEFVSLLNIARPSQALRVTDTLGLLELIVPEIQPLHGLARPPQIVDSWSHTLDVVETLANLLVAISPARSDGTAAQFGLGMLVMQIDRFRTRLIEHIETAWPNERSHRSLLLLAALLHEAVNIADNTGDFESAAAQLIVDRADGLRLSGGETQRLLRVLQNYSRPLVMGDLSPLEIHRFWHQLGAAGVDVCLLAAADYLASAGVYLDQDSWLVIVDRIAQLLAAYYEQYDSLIAPPPLLNGNQLMDALELQPGPIVGRLIDLIREGQVTGAVETVEDALRLARQHTGDEF